MSSIQRNQNFIIKQHIPLKKIISTFTSTKWVIVGASPSLDSKWNEIKKLQSQDWNVAICDMAFGPAIHQNIRPDLLFTCEGKPYPFFNFPGLKINLSKKQRINIIAWAGVHSYQLKQIKKLGPVDLSFFHWEQDEDKISSLPVLPGTGNVTNLMMVLLAGIKNAHLKFFGNDFKYDYKSYYTRGAVGCEEKRLKQSRFYTNELFYYTHLRTSIKINNNHFTNFAFTEYEKWKKKYLDLLAANSNVLIE